MLAQGSGRLYSALRSECLHSSSSHSLLPHRHVHVSRNIRDPFPSGQSLQRGPQAISLSHPLDPSNSSPPSSLSPPNSGTNTSATAVPSTSSSPPRNNANMDEPPTNSGVPTPYVYPTSSRPPYTNPPFDTYAFFKALERTFPTPTAQSLMRATRALLVNRIGKVRGEALSAKDLDNVSIRYPRGLYSS